MMKWKLAGLSVFVALSASAATHLSLLTEATAPSSLQILPPPPASDSATFAADRAVSEALFLHHDAKRWAQAKIDADKSSPEKVVLSFQGAFDLPMSQAKTPAIMQLIGMILKGKSKVTNSAKNYYNRVRPYVYYHHEACQYKKKRSGSYPSGHTTVGWAVALMLAEIYPERQNQILTRGYDYGQNRIVCGAHWQSDVHAGRVTGSALYAALHAKRPFQQLLEQAKAEVKSLTAEH